MARTKWLDGLRGIAAAIVAFDHLFMSDIWHPFVSFWADPPDMNRHIVQLPPIRILFSAHAMVTLFMVISGYAISVGILKDQNTPQFLPKLSSAIVRRLFRIYLPVLVTASLAQFLYFFDLFHWNFDENFLSQASQTLDRTVGPYHVCTRLSGRDYQCRRLPVPWQFERATMDNADRVSGVEYRLPSHYRPLCVAIKIETLRAARYSCLLLVVWGLGCVWFYLGTVVC